MDQESAKLIQFLYDQAESIPHLSIGLGVSATAAIILIFSIAQMWFPKKKKVITIDESMNDVAPGEVEIQAPPSSEKAA